MLSKMALQQACMLLAAGGIGAGSVPAVQKAQKALAKPAVHTAQRKPAVRKPVRHVVAARPRLKQVEPDCIDQGVAVPKLADIQPEPSTTIDMLAGSISQGAGVRGDAAGRLPELAATTSQRHPAFAGVGAPNWGGGGNLMPGVAPTKPEPVIVPPTVPPVAPPGPSPVVVPPIPAGTVPEPGTWIMMIAGFGLVGSAVRWRRAGGLKRRA